MYPIVPPQIRHYLTVRPDWLGYRYRPGITPVSVTEDDNMNANDTRFLKTNFGIRFHHFHDPKGRLVATIVSEPIPDTVVEGAPEGKNFLVQVAAAILFKGKDPIKGLLQEIESAIRGGDEKTAQNLCSIAVAEIEQTKPADVPTRARGREIALGRLEVGDVVMMPILQLMEEISERTILRHFPGGKNLKLRPRAPFGG